MKINCARFIELLTEASESYEPRPYSGRAMYGKKCVGIVIGRDNRIEALIARVMRNVAEEAISAAEDIAEDIDNEGGHGYAKVDNKRQELDDLSTIFSQTRSDGMGLDTIVYWPSMKWDIVEESEIDESEADRG